MATIYLIEQGAKLRKESKRFIIEKDEEILLEIPEFKIDKVFIFGNIQLTTQAMKFLLENGIDVSFFTIYGKFLGKLVSIESKNVLLRISQYEKYKSDEFKLKISKTIVRGKINNAKNVLCKYMRNHPETDFSSSIEELSSLLIEIERKNSVSSVLGVEGRASAVYFECFGKMIIKNFSFQQRIPRHPKDPVNSLLSFGYALLTSELFSSIAGVGFDPYIGYLHSVDYGRPTLALDLIEEFRQPIIDRLVLEIINKGIITPDGFEEINGKIYLNEKSRREFLSRFERRMQTKIQEDNKLLSYREIIHNQTKKFAKTIMEDVEYKPFIIR